MKTLPFNTIEIPMIVEDDITYLQISDVELACKMRLNMHESRGFFPKKFNKRVCIDITQLIKRLSNINKKKDSDLRNSFQILLKSMLPNDINSSLVVEMLGYTPDIQTVIADRAGICYDNETDDPDKLIRRLKLNKHLATFRFAHVTFQISNFSRACSMQVLRHAFLDYLQRSQRYVNEFQFDYVIPPSIANHPEAIVRFKQAMKEDQDHYDFLVKQCKIRPEDARYVLPNACHTKMNIVGNIQAWYDFLYGDAGRLQKAAQWEIRAIAVEIEKHLMSIAPDIFGEIDEK